jgi:hypothetical protein
VQPTPVDPLTQRIGEIRRRLRAVAVARSGVRALFWAACTFAAAAVVDRVAWLGVPLSVLGAAALVAAGLAALVTGALRRPTALEAALAADAQARLKERLASALTLGEPANDMERALLADARARAETVRVEEAAPFAPPRETRWLAAPVALALLALLVLPQGDLFGRKARAAETAVSADLLKDQARRLDQKREALLERAKAQKLEEAPKAAAEMQKISELMKSGDSDKKEAMARISQLAESLKEQKEKLADKGEAARQAMNALSKSPSVGESPLEKLAREGKFGDAAQEIEKLRDKLARGDLSPAEQQQLKSALQRMGDRLAEQLNKMSPDSPGASDMKDLAQGLQDAAKSLDGSARPKDGPKDGQKSGPKDGEKSAGGPKQPSDTLKDLAKDLQGLEQDLSELDSMKDLLQDLDQLKDGLAQEEQPCEGPDKGG